MISDGKLNTITRRRLQLRKSVLDALSQRKFSKFIGIFFCLRQNILYYSIGNKIFLTNSYLIISLHASKDLQSTPAHAGELS